MTTQPQPTDRRKSPERRQVERRTQSTAVAVESRQGERRKVQRRRQIDPTTCERDYTNDEIEFMQALDAYKRKVGNNFPSNAEILQVLLELGYAKQSEEQLAEATHA